MKKKIIYLSIILVLVISLITLSCIYKSKDNKYKKEYNTISKGMAIMIKEEGATDYVQSNSKDIPKGNYVLNEEKTYCENNGKVTNYDNTTGKISLNFIGSDRCYLYFDYKKETIKLGSTELVVNSETPDFNQIATTNEGLFKAQDDLGTSYYFRGAVDNNWVKYGKYTKDMYNCNNGTISATDTGNSCTKIASSGDDIYWRIIRINGDGSIRILWSGKDAPTESTKVVKLDTNNKEYTHSLLFEHMNSSYGNNELTNYIFDNFASTYTNIFDTNIVVNINFCQPTKMFNDIEMTSEAQDQDDDDPGSVCSYWQPFYIFPLASRLYNNNPVFACQNNEEIVSSKSSGLIGDEIITAGLNVKFNLNIDSDMDGNGYYTTLIKELDENKNFYLYNGTIYLSSTLFTFIDCSSMPYEYAVVTNNGSFGYSTISGHLRPVISLSPSVKLSGNGTWNNVYEVVN